MPSKIVWLRQTRGVPSGSIGYRKTTGTGPLEAQPLATLKADLGLNTQIAIVGASDTFQIDVTPFSTQTANQQQWRNLAGNVVSVVDAQGRVVLGSGSFTVSSAFHAVLWQGGAYGWGPASVTGTTAIDTALVRDGGAGIIGSRVGSTPHLHRIYNTFTSSTVYERGLVGFVSGIFTIGCEAAGGGTLRPLQIGLSGNSIGFFGATPVAKPTTGVAAATFVANAGTAVNDASTFDGYTIRQIVAALRTLGLLT